MMIRYSLEHGAFFVRDLGTGFGTFCKVDKPTVIQGNVLISIGSCFLLLSEATEENTTSSQGGAFSDLTNFVKPYGVKN